MANPSNLCYVAFRYGHHSPHSGYSLTAEYGRRLLGADVIRVSKPVSKFLVRERVYWWLARGTPGYTREAISAELDVAWRILRGRNTTYHFLYGESTYHYAGLLDHHRGNRLVATFHAPPVGLAKRVQIDWHLKKLTAVVCLGSSQVEYMSKIVGPERVFQGSLGVDLDFYVPPASFASRDPDLCVFVGENYRDFPTLRGVIELVSYWRPQTKFVAITPPRCYELIGPHPNLEVRTDVPETELLNLYQSASLMVMPLKDAVANNAVLESMACGLPQVITDVGSTSDYVSPDCAVFVPKYAARQMAETVLQLLQAPDERERMSQAAIVQAGKFAWPDVMWRLNDFYTTLG